MRHASLFSGIGGFDLAAQWMGWDNVFQVEYDEWCQKVLTKNFPNVERFRDIKEFDGTKFRGAVDIISGGFPCQPFSHAGKRQGEADDRYLWPEMLRVIREVKPAYVVGENVAGLVSMENGKTLEGIFSDLENERYQVESFIIPACGVGAWHRRDRVWLLAYSDSLTSEIGGDDNADEAKSTSRSNNNRGSRTNDRGESGTREDAEDAPYSDNSGIRTSKSGIDNNKQAYIKGQEGEPLTKSGRHCKDVSNTNIQRSQGDGECREDKGRSDTERYPGQDSRTWEGWEIEPNVGRVANGVSSRVDRLKGLGNAIVPQVAIELFTAIDKLLK